MAPDGNALHIAGGSLAGSPAEIVLHAGLDHLMSQHYQTSNFCFVFYFASTLVSFAARVVDLKRVSSAPGTQPPSGLASWTW